MVDHLVRHNQRARHALWQLQRAEKRRSTRRVKAAVREFLDVVGDMSPSHPDRPACLENLGAACCHWRRWTSDPAAIDTLAYVTELVVSGISEGQQEREGFRRNIRLLVAPLVAGPEKPPGLLSRLTPIAREAALSRDADLRLTFLESLVPCLEESFELTQDSAVLEELIAVERERSRSVPPGSPEMWTYLGNLGGHLLRLALLTGRRETFEEAARVGRQACELGAHDDGHASRLSSFGTTLHALYTWVTRNPATLDEALQYGREAVAAAPSGHPHRASCLSNLMIVLCARFEVSRNLDTLREAVRLGREAVSLAEPDGMGRARYLGNLSGVNQELFKRTADERAIHEAVDCATRAVELTPPDTVLWLNRLSELANALHIWSSGPAAVNEGRAPRPRQAHVTTAPSGDSHSQPVVDSTSALQAAVGMAQKSVAVALPNDRHHPARLSNLSIVARAAFAADGNPAMLRAAVDAAQAAVSAAPADSAMREAALLALAQALALGSDALAALPRMRRCCEELASGTAAPRTRALAHIGLGRTAMEADDAETAVAAYQQAVEQLPIIATRSLLRADREHGLAELAGLPAEAASAALSLRQPERAVLLLERARGLLVREGLGAQHNFDAVHRADPSAAAEFLRLRDLLAEMDRSSSDLYASSLPLGGPDDAARSARRHDLVEAWERLLARIRRISGQENFLCPPSMAQLRQQAIDGPIVLVNVSRHRCDAILLTGDAPVRALPLNFHARHLHNRIDALQAALEGVSKTTDTDARADSEKLILDELAWAWKHIAQPVLAELGLLASTPRHAGEAPRIWWCPIGVAAFLPLHAAGDYSADAEGPGLSVMDHVVSSYTATVAGIRPERTRRPTDEAPVGAERRVLIVEMADTPGVPSLPGAHAEAMRLARRVIDPTLLAGGEATREAVLTALPKHRVVHFACHAVTDSRFPALNRLLLHDHLSAPLTVLDLAAQPISRGDLAYLSACQSAQTNEALADEAVHIATAFQLAGYRHAVGTLWRVDDRSAGRIADHFYESLAPSFRPEETARALHEAVRALRNDAPEKPSRWAAHIHLGD
ncbi:CHAT domain-containing protein [Streptomyces chrestomyceticus]|uniref:CHAT domain-containing protein n=1 Tax=Streptomyces chrestomyceticus TaxID=68185 RepID=UPI003686A0A5